ncbi:hypothetical protein BH23ACT9_BH23ACT9_31940 [soil metagenome]
MHITIETLTIDSPDPEVLALFYEDLLGWVRTYEDDGEILIAAPDGAGFPILFLEVNDPKPAKNRLHFDLRPDDHDAAVAAALELGATHVDVGQGEDPDVTWTVLADPDGNEFCILHSSDGPVDPGTVEEGVAVSFRPGVGGDDPEDDDEFDDLDDDEEDDEDRWDDDEEE